MSNSKRRRVKGKLKRKPMLKLRRNSKRRRKRTGLLKKNIKKK